MRWYFGAYDGREAAIELRSWNRARAISFRASEEVASGNGDFEAVCLGQAKSKPSAKNRILAYSGRFRPESASWCV